VLLAFMPKGHQQLFLIRQFQV